MSDTRPYYHEFAWAYDLLQSDPIVPRVDFIDSVLRSHGVGVNSTILDAGCGTGRYAVGLAERGYSVLGVDRSPGLVAIAKNRALSVAAQASFLIADLVGVSFPRRFDAILCRGVLNDLLEDPDRNAIFRRFAAWLRLGGILIFDVREWTRTAARYQKDSTYQRVVELPDGKLVFRSETTLSPRSHRMDIREHFEVSRNGVTTSRTNRFGMRCWTSAEIKAHLSAAGFTKANEYPSYGDKDTVWVDRLVIVTRKGT